jgi:hypothetical protein
MQKMLHIFSIYKNLTLIAVFFYLNLNCYLANRKSINFQKTIIFNCLYDFFY